LTELPPLSFSEEPVQIFEFEELLLQVDKKLLWVAIAKGEDEFLGFLPFTVGESLLNLVLIVLGILILRIAFSSMFNNFDD
jgi:hypothetical protein